MVTKKIKMKNKDGVVTECDIGAKAENVTQDSTHRFVSDEEKDTWNKKANAEEATQSKAGLLSVADKKKLDGVEEGANKYTHPTTSGNKHIPSGGSAGQVLRWSADGTAVWGADKDTTYTAFKAATSSAAGGAGLVPAPAAGNHDDYLRGDGKWGAASDMVQTFSQASSRSNIASGEANKTLFGKIAKWFADLGVSGIAAFAKVVNNGTTTVANTVLDGRFGKTLLDRIVAAEKNITTINSALTNVKVYSDLVGIKFTPDGANLENSWGTYFVPAGYCFLNAVIADNSQLQGKYVGIITQRYDKSNRMVSLYINWRSSDTWEVLISLAKEKR